MEQNSGQVFEWLGMEMSGELGSVVAGSRDEIRRRFGIEKFIEVGRMMDGLILEELKMKILRLEESK